MKWEGVVLLKRAAIAVGGVGRAIDTHLVGFFVYLSVFLEYWS